METFLQHNLLKERILIESLELLECYPSVINGSEDDVWRMNNGELQKNFQIR